MKYHIIFLSSHPGESGMSGIKEYCREDCPTDIGSRIDAGKWAMRHWANHATTNPTIVGFRIEYW